MLLSTFKNIALVVALTTTSALAASNADSMTDSVKDVHDKLIIARQAIESWNGGLMGGIPLAQRVFNIHQSTEASHKAIDNMDALGGDDRDVVLDVYQRMQLEVVQTIRATEKRVPDFKKLGGGLIVQGLIGTFRADQKFYDKVIQRKVSHGIHRRAARSLSAVEAAFDDLDMALRA